MFRTDILFKNTGTDCRMLTETQTRYGFKGERIPSRNVVVHSLSGIRLMWRLDMKWPVALIASLVFALLIAAVGQYGYQHGYRRGAPRQTVRQITLKTASKKPYGRFLTAARGRAVYAFAADSRARSNCYGKCAQVWPPVVSKTPRAAPPVKPSLVGTIKRKTGEAQVTYNGIPLYYYAGDTSPHQTTGQNLYQFGAKWYLVRPSGHDVIASTR